MSDETTRHLLRLTRPTLLSHRQRSLVIDFVQRLIRASIGCEVFPYGSVPLKTYLPDGDIDLTVLCSPNIEDALVSEVLSVLKAQELNQAAQFHVEDVHCIVAAEVKLVKCIVQNIVVDISFNQIGGLCTLCFLEQVDCLVGKDHLFKCSIILIKAWCYYESRILGSHHGLISTYALEILVLYIFHQFHSSLSDPLMVLYKFLDYFSKFDWENCCVSLNGPVCKASLPEIVVDVSKNGGENVLLCEEFLNRWMDVFSVPLRGPVTNLRGFPKKYLNIFDPLKENNNLGRSVNRGNFYRICSAFKYGACELGIVLSSTGERMADDLKKFFANTIERNVSNYGMEVQCHTLAYGSRGSDYLSPFNKMCFKNRIFSVPSAVGFINGNMLDIEVTPGIGLRNETYCLKAFSSQAVQELDSYANVKPGSTEAANGFASFTSLGMRSKNAPSDCFSLRTYKGSSRDLSGISRGSKASESLLDLSGDYDSHFKSLLYGQSCLVNSSSVSTLSRPATICDPIQLEQNDFSQTNTDGAISGVPQLHSTNYSVSCNAGLGSRENKELQGTATYFPRMNYRSCKDRPSQGGIRNKTPNSCRNLQSNSGNKGVATISEGNNVFLRDHFSVTAHGKSKLSEMLNSESFGSISEESNQTNTAAVHSPKAVLEYNDERVVEQTYQLKDEYEFPPLSLTIP